MRPALLLLLMLCSAQLTSAATLSSKLQMRTGEKVTMTAMFDSMKSDPFAMRLLQASQIITTNNDIEGIQTPTDTDG